MVVLRLLLGSLCCLLIQGKPAWEIPDQVLQYAEAHPKLHEDVNLEYGDLIEGDIEVGPDEDWPPTQIGPLNAVWDKSLLWPDNVLYYTLNYNNVFTDEEIVLIEAGIEDLINSTKVNGDLCINIVESQSEADYVFVSKTGGCSSAVGMRGGRQSMSLEASCITRHGTIMHEFLHALGYYHEQSRGDRDDYVIINWDNIEEGREHNFVKYEEGVTIDHMGTHYDYGSVLHYSAYSFAIDGSIPTIIPLDPEAEIGQRTHLSECDIERVKILYGCIEPETAGCLKEDEIANIKRWLKN